MDVLSPSTEAIPELSGKKIIVVGASSGIGRSIAVIAARSGATVAVAARRGDLLEALIAEPGVSELRAFPCDVREESGCRYAIEAAIGWLGGIDHLHFMAGSSPLVRVEEATMDDWHSLLDTNLVGAAVAIRAAMPYLRASGDPTFVVTTHSMGEPWPWLACYAAAKAGLAELARGIRSEERWLRSVCVSVGSTATSFADAWDPDVFSKAMSQWVAEERLRYSIMSADEMATEILRAVVDREGPDELTIHGEEESR